MPTRITVAFGKATMEVLSQLARQENKSIARLTKKLILESLDDREDKALSRIGDARESKKAKRVKHEDAWK